MRIGSLVIMLLVVGIIMFTVFQMLGESEELYSLNIDDSEWSEKYDFANQVNEEIVPIKDSIDTIQNEDEGWLEKVGAGFTGIIAAVTFIPSLAWVVISLTTELITGLGNSLGVPPYITLVLIIMITVWIVFKLLEVYQNRRI